MVLIGKCLMAQIRIATLAAGIEYAQSIVSSKEIIHTMKLSELVEKYDVTGPRYTSYPTVAEFHTGFNSQDYRHHAARSNELSRPKPLSLYFHIPFCESLCYYCGCYKVITNSVERKARYIEYVQRETVLQSALFAKGRDVRQIHFGGGTPTALSTSQINAVLAVARESFSVATQEKLEQSIEIDPRTTTKIDIEELASMGFNRMSFGVQDFDPTVQQAINRLQGEEETIQLMQGARNAGVESISVDLVYGLPYQTLDRFEKTLELIASFRPNRVAIYNYAHLPERIKSQRKIQLSALPTPTEKLMLLELARDMLITCGYQQVGIDHFVLPADSLAQSVKQKTLHRNFQGYSTNGDCDLIGLGASAISKVGDCYSQNYANIKDYELSLKGDEQPVWRGYALNADDRLRRDIIMKIMCAQHLKFSSLSKRYHIDFAKCFSHEIQQLRELAKDGLIELREDELTITTSGTQFLRNIAMVFDTYLTGHQKPGGLSFSKAI